MTYSPTLASGTYARLTSLIMPPKSTLPVRHNGSSPAILVTFPGMARHIGPDFTATIPARQGIVGKSRERHCKSAKFLPPRLTTAQSPCESLFQQVH